MMAKEREYDVFLSYSREDSEWASQFAESLREAGLRAWFDVHNLLPGEKWMEQIQKALRESNTLIVILSPKSARSPWTFFELGAAVASGKRIVPVMAQDVPPQQVPGPLRHFQYLVEPSPDKAGRRVAEVLMATSARAAPADHE
jgi:nucleoside 2-deoxyribosyltransferase